MPQFFSQVMVGSEQVSTAQKSSLWLDEDLVFDAESADEDQALNALIFKVRRNPKDLKAHLRRIYFCYQKRLASQLYAALLDFLIVLRGKGRAISRRMIVGSHTFLDEQQILSLKRAANVNSAEAGNRFSLFTSGLVGKCELVEIRHQDQQNHDYLVLANDFIEYSQLDQAMDVLETGVTANPERHDLQEALLELYQSTRNKTRFDTFYRNCLAADLTLVDDWRTMAKFFEGQE